MPESPGYTPAHQSVDYPMGPRLGLKITLVVKTRSAAPKKALPLLNNKSIRYGAVKPVTKYSAQWPNNETTLRPCCLLNKSGLTPTHVHVAAVYNLITLVIIRRANTISQ